MEMRWSLEMRTIIFWVQTFDPNSKLNFLLWKLRFKYIWILALHPILTLLVAPYRLRHSTWQEELSLQVLYFPSLWHSSIDPSSHVQHFKFSAPVSANTPKNNFIFLSKTTFITCFYNISEMLRSYLYSGVESSLSSTIHCTPLRQCTFLG